MFELFYSYSCRVTSSISSITKRKQLLREGIALKGCLQSTSRSLINSVAVSALIVGQAVPAWADVLPTGGRVAAGQATISLPGGHTMTIDQTSGGAIINWDGFSIGNGNSVIFNNGNGATLNRVLGSDVSSLDGLLSSSGSVFLVNRNGIVVGKDGVILTGGSFVASTLDIGDADFLNGDANTFSGDSNAMVLNLGKISSLGGDLALIARNVHNAGEMTAAYGTSGLIAGREVVMRDGALDDGLFYVRLGDSASSATNSGTIEAASAELRANLGNVYALAGNTGGAINATGSARSGGRIFLTAPGGKVKVGKGAKLKARRESAGRSDGGEIKLEAAQAVVGGSLDVSGMSGGAIWLITSQTFDLAGMLDASGSAGTGGTVDVAGAVVALSGADIDVSGRAGGGRVRIGGAFQGGVFVTDDGKTQANSDRVTIDDTTVIAADGTGAGSDGGTVIVWSENETHAGGAISGRGGSGGSGGFVELSSRGLLDFTADVDTGGGTLLLDPSNIEITDGSGTKLEGASEIAASSIVTALGSNNVIIHTSGSENEAGTILVSSHILYDSIHDLSFLAQGDLFMMASVQNSNDSAGAINLVAGWDGTTGYVASSGSGNFDESAGALDYRALETTSNAYGIETGATYTVAATSRQASGSIIIGDGSQTFGVAVGSRSGATRVYGHDLVLTASDNSTPFAYAQLGFRGKTTAGADYDVTGELSARLTGDISATAGASQLSYTQLGHGGASTRGNYSGDITIAANDLNFTGGNRSMSYAQLGHGGASTRGNYSGDITIAANDLTFTGGNGPMSYAQLGHGGFAAVGNQSGGISVTANDLTFKGGGAHISYAQLGHGGSRTNGAQRGDISVTAAGTLMLTGGSNWATYAQLGHGSASSHWQSTGTRQGDIFVDLTGEQSVEDGTGSDAFGWIGHGTSTDDGILDANIFVRATGFDRDADASLSSGGLSVFSYDMIENGLRGGNVTLVATDTSLSLAAPIIKADTTYDSHHDLTLVAAGDLEFTSVGLRNENDSSGDINLVAGYDTGQTIWDIDVDDTSSWVLRSSAFDNETLVVDGTSFGLGGGSIIIGDGSQTFGVAVGSRSGATRVYGHDLVLTGFDNSTRFAYAQLGFRGKTTAGADYDVTGELSARLTGDISATAGASQWSYAQLGHGGASTLGNYSGDITIAANDLTFTGGNGLLNYAQLGHGGFEAVGNQSGGISVTANDLTFTGGNGLLSYAQLGHGGFAAVGNQSGGITIAASDLTFTGGNGPMSYAQLGHGGFAAGGFAAVGNQSGGISVTANDLTFTGGNGLLSYAQLGHGGSLTNGAQRGDISVTAAGTLMLTGGSNWATYAQLGHGSASSDWQSTGSRDGEITINAAIDVTDGSGRSALAQIGHKTATP